MTGLENILKSISDEAESAASRIIEDANKEAKKIVDKGKEQADIKAEGIIKEAQDQAAKLLDKEMSAAEFEKKKIILRAKQKHINSLINEAKNSIKKLDDHDYFTVILKMIEKFSTLERGEILFSQKDKDRLPEDFLDKLNRTMNFKGGSLKISDQTRNIDGGFILVYGGIEENCSLDALFDSAKDALSDGVNKLLFFE